MAVAVTRLQVLQPSELSYILGQPEVQLYEGTTIYLPRVLEAGNEPLA